ncbi:MAG: hypothetical protein ACRYGR_06605 [Janthinobacterium lividum]
MRPKYLLTLTFAGTCTTRAGWSLWRWWVTRRVLAGALIQRRLGGGAFTRSLLAW